MKLAFINAVQVGYRTRPSGKLIFYKVLPYMFLTAFVSVELTGILDQILLIPYLAFNTVFRYPIVHPQNKCSGDQKDLPGIRSYNVRPAHERYDVYCYVDQLKGE